MNITLKSCLRIALSIFLLYLAIHYWPAAAGLLGTLLSAAAPLLIGAALAYVVNLLMSAYEKRFFPRSTNTKVIKLRRPVCMLLAYISLLAIITVIVWLILPELVDCVELLISQLPGAIETVIAWLDTVPFLSEELLSTLHSIDWQSKIGDIAGIVTSGVGNVMGVVISTVSSVFSAIVTGFLAFIFSLYLLLGRDKLQSQCKRLMAHYLPEKLNSRILYVLAVLNNAFRRYITGQCIEAVILGALCAAGMLILRLPYATMIGALIAFTALIPVAGAYIGAAVGAFMIAMVSPMQALIFLIFLVVLQQLEGNLIYPKVVGSSLGLPGIWVLAAVTVGGGVMGVLGMLLGVPLAAAAYTLLRNDMNKNAAPTPVEAEAEAEIE
ncbi:MAG: AI-2E family transporter [Ruminococcaceae bacterium]|nr:AI-2E family transporter [Oscillospiraceae bacterium]